MEIRIITNRKTKTADGRRSSVVHELPPLQASTSGNSQKLGNECESEWMELGNECEGKVGA